MAGRDAPTADPLENFRCIKGKRYLLPEKWCYKSGAEELLDVRKALNNLSDFVRDVRSLRPKRYQFEPKVTVDDDLSVPRRIGPATVNKDFTIDRGEIEHQYKYAAFGPILSHEGKLESNHTRVIFTPSKGRWEIGFLRWSGEENLVDTLGVVVVPLNELREYSDKWGATRLIIGVDHECVGEVRYHIIQLARHWELKTFWMIDDSVPTSKLYEKTRGNEKGDLTLGFDHVLRTIESMDCFSKPVLIGLASTFSIQKLKEEADQYAVNTRTPTSCVFVCLRNIPEELNYERQLPSKEDVIFAAQLIDAGRDVIIDRYIHFADYPFTKGGCADYRGNEETDSKDTDNGSALTKPFARMKLSN